MLLILFFFFVFLIFSKYLGLLLQDIELSQSSVKKYKMPVLKCIRVITGLQIRMYLFFWVSSIGGVLTSLSYLYWWSPEWEVQWTCGAVAVQPCEKLLSYWKTQLQYVNYCSGCSNYCFGLRVSVTLTNCSTDKTSWSPWCFHWVGKQCLKWINWQEIYGCPRKSHCTSPGQPHQWGQKFAQREASLPLPPDLLVTGSVPSVPLSSAPSFSLVGVWRVCRNLALLTSTNFMGGEGDVHFQGWMVILFAWKMSGAIRKSGESRLQASLWQFEQEEVGKWNRVGIISSFGAATLWRSHFCFPSPEFGENKDLWVSRREKGHEHHIILPVGRLTIFFWLLSFFFSSHFVYFLSCFMNGAGRVCRWARLWMFYVRSSGASYG